MTTELGFSNSPAFAESAPMPIREDSPLYVRSQDHLALDSKRATGRRLKKWQAEQLVGVQKLARIAEDGVVAIYGTLSEPAATIKAKREQLGISASHLAARLKLFESDITRIENPSKQVSIQELDVVSRALGIDIDKKSNNTLIPLNIFNNSNSFCQPSLRVNGKGITDPFVLSEVEWVSKKFVALRQSYESVSHNKSIEQFSKIVDTFRATRTSSSAPLNFANTIARMLEKKRMASGLTINACEHVFGVPVVFVKTRGPMESASALINSITPVLAINLTCSTDIQATFRNEFIRLVEFMATRPQKTVASSVVSTKSELSNYVSALANVSALPYVQKRETKDIRRIFHLKSPVENGVEKSVSLKFTQMVSSAVEKGLLTESDALSWLAIDAPGLNELRAFGIKNACDSLMEINPTMSKAVKVTIYNEDLERTRFLLLDTLTQPTNQKPLRQKTQRKKFDLEKKE